MRKNNHRLLRNTIFLISLLCCLQSQSHAQNNPSKQVSFHADRLTVKESIDSLARQYDLKIAYRNQLKGLDDHVTININSSTIDSLIIGILQPHNITWKKLGSYYLLKSMPAIPKKVIQGYIRDSLTGEALIGANIFCVQSKTGTSTNVYGHYAIPLDEKLITVRISYVGYKTIERLINLTTNLHFNWVLSPSLLLPPVEITAGQNLFQKMERCPSIMTLHPGIQHSLPSLSGSPDILKQYQTMSGVSFANEGSGNPIIRGGETSQNLIQLDGVPLYYVSHLLGLFSIFNPNTINYTKLYKGNFPARYGGRISSIIDIRMKEGNMQNHEAVFNIGILAGDATFNGPIVKNKASYLVGIRRPYLDLLTKSILKHGAENPADLIKFHDINLKTNIRIGNKNSIYASLYKGKDKLDLSFNSDDGNTNFEWGNSMISLRWNSILSSSLFMNATAYGGLFNFSYLDKYDNISANYATEIGEWGLKTDFDFVAHTRHHLYWGAGYNNILFKSDNHHQNTDQSVIYHETPTTLSNSNKAFETFIYIEDEFKISPSFTLNTGLRHTLFSASGNYYSLPQPRIYAIWAPLSKLTLTAGYSKMLQNVHKYQIPGFDLPTDIWIPAQKNIPPEKCDQTEIGIIYTPNEDLRLQAEIYNKYIINFPLLTLNPSFESSTFFDINDSQKGHARMRGIEFMTQYTYKKIFIQCAYTYTQSQRKFAAINLGQWYSYRFERPHKTDINVHWKGKKNPEISLHWIAASGRAINLPNGVITTINDNQIAYIYPFKNSLILPLYHRLDISFSWRKKIKWGQRSWNIGIYNAYNQKNAFTLYLKDEKINVNGVQNRVISVKKLSIFPIIPMISYTLKIGKSWKKSL